MSTVRDPEESLRLRRSIANLFRIAHSSLTGARTLLGQDSSRGAAVLIRDAVTLIVKAVAASEHGWRLGKWDTGLFDVPKENPVRADLADVEARLDTLATPVGADGAMAAVPDARPLLDRVASLLQTLTDAFGVDLEASAPAETDEPLRPEPPPEPKRRSASPQVERREPASVQDQPRRKARIVKSPVAPQPDRPERPPHPAIVGHSRPAPDRALKTSVQQGGEPARSGPQRQAAAGRKTAQGKQAPETGAAGPSSEAAPLQPNRRVPDVTSAAFWSLMDRWKVGDLEALDLIGHSGGLTKKGTRPRFRLVGAEAELFSFLREIDAALEPMRRDPATWLRTHAEAPDLAGETPLEHIVRHGIAGARDVLHVIMAMGLQAGL